MYLGLQLTAIYHDHDLLKLRITASNNHFAGTADVYVSLDEPEQIASALQHFPHDPSDTRAVSIGSFKPDALAGVQLDFYCSNRAGHAYLKAQIQQPDRSTSKNPSDPTQVVTLYFRIEPAGLDSFLVELRTLGVTKTGSAHLPARIT